LWPIQLFAVRIVNVSRIEHVFLPAVCIKKISLCLPDKIEADEGNEIADDAAFLKMLAKDQIKLKSANQHDSDKLYQNAINRKFLSILHNLIRSHQRSAPGVEPLFTEIIENRDTRGFEALGKK
jgi:hypothetical protein